MANNPNDFDIYKILNAENTHVRLTCYGDQGITIDGFLTNDTFPLQGNASYQDLTNASVNFAEIGSAALGGAGKALGGIANIIARTSNVSKRPAFTTLSYWDTTEKPQFQVDLLFVRYSLTQPENTTPLYCAKNIVARCFPLLASEGGTLWSDVFKPISSKLGTILGGALGSSLGPAGAAVGAGFGTMFNSKIEQGLGQLERLGFLSAPNGYNPIDSVTNLTNPYGSPGRESTKGTWSLQIGKWFKAYNLILQNAQFEASKEVAPDGTPIYVQGSIQLESCILITYDEYLGWFKQ